MNEKMELIRLTSKVLEALNPDDIIYAEFADFGAMGACGSARIFALEGEKMNFYLTGDTYNNKTDEKYLNEAIDYLVKLRKADALDYAYGGFGNSAFKKRGAKFGRDDDKCRFIYQGATIPASTCGVYHHIAATFAPREVSAEELEKHYEENRPGMASAETDFYEAYVEQVKRADAGSAWFDFSPVEYYNAIKRIKHETGVEVILNWGERIECRAALQKYRLQYVVDKIGWNKLDGVFSDLVKDGAFDVFARISEALGEKIEEIYSELKTIELKDSKLAKMIKDGASVHIYSHHFGELFSAPVLIDFTPDEHKKICDDILKLSGGSLRAGAYGFYFANYVLNEDRFSYAEVLPAVAHIVKELPFDDFNHTHNEELFYFCGEIIDNCWRYASEDENMQKCFRNFVYGLYWPRVESLWPIVHRDEIEFRDPAGGKMFDDAASFVLSLNDIDERNTEVKKYLEKAVQAGDIDYANPLGRRAFCYSLKRFKKPEEEFEAIMSGIRPDDWYSFLAYPETVEEAEILLAEIFNDKKDARMTGYTRISVLEALVITANAAGVGKYILSYIHENFDKLAKIIAAIEESEKALEDLFIAASRGISEEDELEPLAQVKGDLVKYGCEKERLEKAEEYAKKRQKTVAFQRAKLTLAIIRKIC